MEEHKTSKTSVLYYPDNGYGDNVAESQSADSERIKFPTMIFRIVEKFDFVPERRHTLIGASWNHLLHTPHFMARKLMFENLYFPYNLDHSKYFKIKHNVLLWPRINLNTFTYIPDQRIVFIEKNGELVIQMKFEQQAIIMNELKKPLNIRLK